MITKYTKQTKLLTQPNPNIINFITYLFKKSVVFILNPMTKLIQFISGFVGKILHYEQQNLQIGINKEGIP